MFTVCVECGGYLVDRDESVCRACGADNAEPDDLIELDDSLDVDRLDEWSHVKHEIVSKYACAHCAS